MGQGREDDSCTPGQALLYRQFIDLQTGKRCNTSPLHTRGWQMWPDLHPRHRQQLGQKYLRLSSVSDGDETEERTGECCLLSAVFSPALMSLMWNWESSADQSDDIRVLEYEHWIPLTTDRALHFPCFLFAYNCCQHSHTVNFITGSSMSLYWGRQVTRRGWEN